MPTGTLGGVVVRTVALVALRRLLVVLNNRDRVLLDWDRETPEAATATPAPAPALPAGTRGKGLVLGVTPALTYDGDGNPVFDVVLHLEFDGRPPESVPARFGVPLDRVAGMLVGTEVAVLVDPHGVVVPIWQ